MKLSVNPAKITPPILDEVVHRYRLYKTLDTDKSVIWISGPGGYGKTTLINGYISEKNIPYVWYKIDAGDRDIASFFYYLGQAVKKSTGKRKLLPLLKPEYQLGVSAFTRHYFRDLFAQLKPGSVLVFDNFQDVGNDSELYNLLHEIMEEIADGIRIILLSREEPPSKLSTSNTDKPLLHIDAKQLEFSVDECTAITKLIQGQQDIELETVNKIHSLSKGWVTGFKLFLEQSSDLDIDALKQGLDYHENIFDYFANEVLQHIEPEFKKLLLETSLFSSFTASNAASLTGIKQSKKLLSQFVKKQFFISRHGRFNPAYEYHPLFRQFLLERLEEEKGDTQLSQLNQKAGKLLFESGSYEDAIELLIKSESYELIADILLKQSKKLVGQGRNKQLVVWIEILPKNILNKNAWLYYWLGLAYLQYNNNKSRDCFISSYNQFKNDSDIKGLYLSWCGIADSYSFAHDDFSGSHSWVTEMEWLTLTYPTAPNIESRIRMIVSTGMLLAWIDPLHPKFSETAQKLEKIVKYIPIKPLRILCLTQLVFYYGQKGYEEEIKELTIQVDKYITDKSLPDVLKVMLHVLKIFIDFWSNTYLLTNQQIDNYNAEIKEKGMTLFGGFFYGQALYHSGVSGDAERTRYLLNQYQENLNEKHKLDLGHYYLHSSVCLILENKSNLAISQIKKAIDITVVAQAIYPECLSRSVLAYLYIDTGEYEQAKSEINKTKKLFNKEFTRSASYLVDLMECWILYKQEELLCLQDRLQDAFGYASCYSVNGFHFWPRKMIVDLCIVALENNIHTEYVNKLIQLHRLKPNTSSPVVWPYPVKIYAMNRFGILKDDESIRPGSKVQSFIKALIAFGGRDVTEETLSNALWPDAEGDAAHQSFATTLHRVRKQLGNDIVQLRQNQVSLNQQYCWLDTWSFQRALNDITDAIGNSHKNVPELVEKVLGLYQGPFLGLDENEYWIISAREKLNNLFLRVITDAADYLVNNKQYSHALRCYQQGLEIDELSERLYRGLMQCHAQQGNRAEAITTYQRCCELLDKQLDISPSNETESLYSDIKTT